MTSSRVAIASDESCSIVLQEFRKTTSSHLNRSSLDYKPSTGQSQVDHGVEIMETAESMKNVAHTTPPSTAASVLQNWNHPKSNMWRTFAAFYSFLILGLSAAAYGALIPYIETYYNTNYTIIALVFLMGFPGYIVSAVSTHHIHQRFGQRGIAIIGVATQILTWTAIALHPPFPVVIVMFAIQGFSFGIIDSAWNAWLANMANAHQIMGFLHGFFGLGGALSPLIATALVTKVHWPWYSFYWVMVGTAVVEAFTVIPAFWKSNGTSFRAVEERPDAESDRNKAPLREVALARSNRRLVWLCSSLLWIYVGVEISLGGWIVAFMLKERQGTQFASGMTATGFWLGITVGRLVLGFVTPRVGERWAVAIYLFVSAILEIIFWRAPSFLVSAIAVALQGFFLGPIFPSALVVATGFLPKHLHVTAISFISAVGASGGSVWPFVVGAIAQKRGVETLQPIILALLSVILVIWLLLPRGSRKTD